jgi:hypothetical protein
MPRLFDGLLPSTSVGSVIQGFALPNLLNTFSVGLSKHKPTRTKILGGYYSLVFDANEDFTPKFDSKVTSHPVEDGAEISDHIIKLNPTFSLRGIYSDYSRPLNRDTFLTQQEFYQTLLKIRDDNTLVSLLTPLDTFTDLTMKSVAFPKKTGDGTSLYIDIEFEKLRRVSSEQTVVFVSSISKVKGTTTVSEAKTSGDTAVKVAGEVAGGSRSALTVVIESAAKTFGGS